MFNNVQGISSTFGVGALQPPQPLTSDQKSTVQSILSQYDPTKITAADAKSIFTSLRDAGIKPNSEVRGMLTSAGFDPEKLRSMAGVGGHHHGHQQGSGQSDTTGSTSGVDLSTLESLQSILDQYNLTSLSPDQENDLRSQLSGAGLTQSGSLINLSA